MELLERSVAWVQRRLVWADVLRRAPLFLLAAWSLVLAGTVASRLGGFWFPIEETLAAAAAAALAACGAVAWWRRPDPAEAAQEIDRRFALAERVASAWSVAREDRPSPLAEAVVADAVRQLRAVRLADGFRLPPGRWAWIAPLPAVLACLAAWLVPPARSSAQAADDRQVQQAVEQVRQVRAAVQEQRSLARERNVPEQAQWLDRLDQSLADLEQRVAAEPQAAQNRLTDVAQEIAQRRKRLAGVDQARRQLQQMQRLGAGPAEKLAAALKEGDFDRAAAELARLREQLAGGTADPAARQQLADQFRQLQEKLNQLHQAQAQRREELQDRLAQQQAAGADQAQQDALAEQLEDLEPSSQLQALDAVAEQLRQAADGLADQPQGSDRPEQPQQALQQAEQALAQLAEQMDQASFLDQMLQGLSQCQQGLCGGSKPGSGEGGGGSAAGQDGSPRAGHSPAGKPGDRGRPGGAGQRDRSQGAKQLAGPGGGPPGGNAAQGNRPGRGQGAGIGDGQRPEAEDATATFDSRVVPDAAGGRSVVTGYADGPNRPGQAGLASGGTGDAAASTAADPLQGVKLPRSYRDHAQDYFRQLRQAP